MTRVSYHASVITGLERLAAEEVKEKLNVQAVIFQGHIRFESDADPNDVLALRSIDNVYAVIGREKPDGMPQNESDLTSKLQSFHDSLDWTAALTAWRQVTGFEKSDMETILTKVSGLDLTGDQTEPDDKRPKDILPKFRVTCHRAGEGHGFQSGDAAKEMGGIINGAFNWPVSMKEFDLEVVLFVKDNEWTLGISLTKDSLHRRNLVSIGVTSLRATVCYAMLRMAELQVGDILCDPLCGSSAILVESSVAYPHVYNLAGDHHNQAIAHSAANISHIRKSDKSNGPVDILQFDTTKLPFKSGLVDAIVSDLPFGKRIGNKTVNFTLYPKLLKEFARITVPTTGRAVLLTQDWKNLSKSLDSELMRKCWRMKFKMFLKLGNLATYIYILKRTSYVTN